MVPALRMASMASFMGIKTVVLTALTAPPAEAATEKAAIPTLSGNSPMATMSYSPKE